MAKLNYFHKNFLSFVMFEQNFSTHNPRPKVLLSPLDWGLGHATRCVPIIKELIDNGCEVILAAAGNSRLVLQGEFPDLRCLSLPAYKIHYSRRRSFFMLSIILQLPRILLTIYKEHRWLKKV